MREIFQLFLSAGGAAAGLPPPEPTTAEAQRIYVTSFLVPDKHEDIPIASDDGLPEPASSTPAACRRVSPDTTIAPSPVRHQRALHQLHKDLAVTLDEAPVGQVVSLFAATARISRWADRVFRQLTMSTTASSNTAYVLRRPDGTPSPDTTTVADGDTLAEVFALRSSARNLRRQNQRWMANKLVRAICGLVSSPSPASGTASSSAGDREHAALIDELAAVVQDVAAEGLTNYREVVEAPLLAALHHRGSTSAGSPSPQRTRANRHASPPAAATTAAGTPAVQTPGPTQAEQLWHAAFGAAAADPVAAAERFARAAAALPRILHETSVVPVLEAVADAVFPTAEALERCLLAKGGQYLAAGDHRSLRGLQISFRKEHWHEAMVRVAAGCLLAPPTVLTADTEELAAEFGAALERLAAWVATACVPMGVAIDAVVRWFIRARDLSSGSVHVGKIIAALLDQLVAARRLPLFPGVHSSNILHLLKYAVAQTNAAEDLCDAVVLSAKRRSLRTSAWCGDSEVALVEAMLKMVPCGDWTGSLRRLIHDVEESTVVGGRLVSVGGPSFVQLRAMSSFAMAWSQSITDTPLRHVPLPPALLDAWTTAQTLYREAHPRRLLLLVPHLSRVVLEWRATRAEIAMSSAHFAVFDRVAAGDIRGVTPTAIWQPWTQLRPHSGGVMSEAVPAALPDVVDSLLADLVAAGVLVRVPAQLLSPPAAAADACPGQRTERYAVAKLDHRRRFTVATGSAAAAGAGTSGHQPKSAAARASDARAKRMYLEAAVMKHLKAAGELSVTALRTAVHGSCASRGASGAAPPTRAELDRVLDSLAEREFIDRRDDTVCYRA